MIMNFLADGNSHWLGLLFKKYQAVVYGICWKYLENREDARDATMEIFEKLHLDIQKFEIQQFKYWLYKVAKNHCLMKLRKKQPQLQYTDNMDTEWETKNVSWDGLHDSESEAENDQRQQENKLNDCLKKMKSKEQQLCIDLFYYQEKSYKEIETQTGLSFKEVKSYIQNGKLNLKKCLERKN